MSNQELDATIKALEAEITKAEQELKRLKDRQIELGHEHSDALYDVVVQRACMPLYAPDQAMKANKKTSKMPEMNKESRAMLHTLCNTLDQAKTDIEKEEERAKEAGLDMVYESVARCQKFEDRGWRLGCMEVDEEPKTKNEQE